MMTNYTRFHGRTGRMWTKENLAHKSVTSTMIMHVRFRRQTTKPCCEL